MFVIRLCTPMSSPSDTNVYVRSYIFSILYETVNDFTPKAFFLRKENETRRRITMKGVFARIALVFSRVKVKYNFAGNIVFVVLQCVLRRNVQFLIYSSMDKVNRGCFIIAFRQ